MDIARVNLLHKKENYAEKSDNIRIRKAQTHGYSVFAALEEKLECSRSDLQ